MPFQFVDVSKNSSLKPSSIKLYRAHLNKLSKEGYDTQQKLIDNSKDILKYIDELYSDNRKKRVMLSAIFYILCDTLYLKSPNDYYNYFQTIKSE